METSQGAAGRTPHFLASCYKERKEAEQRPLLSGLSPAGSGGLDCPVHPPSPPSAPGAQTKEAAEDQEVRGWEIPGPPGGATLLFHQPPEPVPGSTSKQRGDGDETTMSLRPALAAGRGASGHVSLFFDVTKYCVSSHRPGVSSGQHQLPMEGSLPQQESSTQGVAPLQPGPDSSVWFPAPSLPGPSLLSFPQRTPFWPFLCPCSLSYAGLSSQLSDSFAV